MGTPDGVESSASRLPREGCLFIGLGDQDVDLSSLKEQMRSSDAVDFQAPEAQASRPWSSRTLVADGAVALGWTSGANSRDCATLRVEGMPGDQFFRARRALYKNCALV